MQNSYSYNMTESALKEREIDERIRRGAGLAITNYVLRKSPDLSHEEVVAEIKELLEICGLNQENE